MQPPVRNHDHLADAFSRVLDQLTDALTEDTIGRADQDVQRVRAADLLVLFFLTARRGSPGQEAPPAAGPIQQGIPA